MKEKILLTKTNHAFFYKGNDVHTQHGFVKKEDIENAKDGSIVITNKGTEMTLLEPNFMDYYSKIKRNAQVIPKKDIGAIISETGINKNSKILESGGGSGATTLALANIAKSVTTYEIREDFHDIVKHNVDFLKLKNVKLRLQSLYDGLKKSDKDFDLVVLDLPDPWKAIPVILSSMKPNSFIVSYSPTIPQTMDFVEECSKHNLLHLKTIEIILREWDIFGRKVRPKTRQEISHSGFLTFVKVLGV